ncbi:MAG: sporulation protein [Limnohabitans sp.]|nr:sporulation protein [Limnohabitans sp.]
MKSNTSPSFNTNNTQKGGTLVGFILGLVVGLLVALCVAIYVTKVPIPFLNKGLSRSANQDAAEEKKNKDWDPNAPLYGKNPVKSSSVLEKEKAPPGILPSPDADKPPTSAESADPLGDLARSKAGADPFNYYVQAGAFRTPEEAESQRAKLSLNGYDAKVSEREQAGRSVFRVRIGPFYTREDAEKIQDKLKHNKVETALVRMQR